MSTDICPECGAEYEHVPGHKMNCGECLVNRVRMVKLVPKKMKTAFLEISTFRGGLCVEATHFYGRLRCGDKEMQLEFKLTSREAKLLNRRDEVTFYKKGSLSSRYETEQEVIDQAVKTYKTLFPEAGVLIRGSYSTLDPRPMLDGPADLMERANAIVAECEAIDWWDGGKDAEMRKLSRQWEGLLKEAGVER